MHRWYKGQVNSYVHKLIGCTRGDPRNQLEITSKVGQGTNILQINENSEKPSQQMEAIYGYSLMKCSQSNIFFRCR